MRMRSSAAIVCGNSMPDGHADALVLFGATGDLAYEQIFPALQAMTRRGHLDIPVIGVAKPDWTVEQLRARAQQSIAAHGGLDAEAFAKLATRLSYVAGDYQDPATFDKLRQALGSAERPLFYLAIPPSLFGTVASGLARSGCAAEARVVVEKPFGRDLASAKALNATLHQSFPEPAVYRIDHFLGKEPVQNLLYFRFANAISGAHLECRVRRERADHDGGNIRRARPRRFLRGRRRRSRRLPESFVAGPRRCSRWTAGERTTARRSTPPEWRC